MRASKARAGRRTGKRVTGAGAHTASRKATEEGTVHFALPPPQHRITAAGVLRALRGNREVPGLASGGVHLVRIWGGEEP